MHAKLALIAIMMAVVEARFGREQEVAPLVQALGNFGNPGAAATLAGQTPSALLAGANACIKLQLADEIVAQLGNDPQVIAAAQALVQAEKNTNPFAVAIPSICSDANLPATEELRGIIPLIDPDTEGADIQNANAAASLNNPFNANGLSVAEVSAAQGFDNFTAQGSDGATADAPAAGNGGGNNNNNNNNQNDNAGNDNNENAGNGNQNCGATVTVTVAAPAATAAPANNNNNNNNQNNNQNGNAGNANNNNNGAADFGDCNPQMDFQLGRAGRKPDEGTFLPVDPVVALGQQDALNPNIITNRICDQLTNVCNANQAAKDLCEEAKAVVQGLGTKDATTADAFNQALGF